MDFFKRYSALLLPGGLVVFAMVLFVPTWLISRSIQSQMDNSISLARKIQSLKQRAVSRRQWEVEKKYQQKHGEDANAIATLAMQSSQRALLSYKIFPGPKSSSAQLFKEFEDNYVSGIEGLIRQINGKDSPTEQEIRLLLGTSDQKSRRGRVKFRGSGTDQQIRESFYCNRAESISIYANPAGLSGYEFWQDYKYLDSDKAVEDCWYFQLAYWIQQDIIDTIERLNGRSGSVYTSPVKHLLGINFNGTEGDGKKDKTDRPRYVVSEDGMLTASLTKRVCDDDVDVVHFSVAVVVRSKAVLAFMRELCSEKEHTFKGYDGKSAEHKFKHNQITILESDIELISRDTKVNTNYRYGDDAVVRLNLVCEYIFNRSGYDAIKPKSVKKALGQLEEEKTKGKKPRRRRGRGRSTKR